MHLPFYFSILLILLTISSFILADQNNNEKNINKNNDNNENQHKKKRVLIIGSGINGASTAYFLRAQLNERAARFRSCCCDHTKQEAEKLKTTSSQLDQLVSFWLNRTEQSNRNFPSSSFSSSFCPDDADSLCSSSASKLFSCSSDEKNNDLLEIVVAEEASKVGGRVRKIKVKKGKVSNTNNNDENEDDQDEDDEEEEIVELGATVYHNVNYFMSFFAEHLLPKHLDEKKISGRRNDKKRASAGKIRNDENKNLNSNVDGGGLRTRPYKNSKFGVYNGNRFKFKEPPGDDGLWTKMKTLFSIFWRYWLSPLKVQWCVDRLVDKLLAVYKIQLVDKQFFASAQDLLSAVNLLKYSQNISAIEFFDKECKLGFWSDNLFLREFGQAIARLNYGQNIDELSALGAAVALKGRGDTVFAVRGGNDQIIEMLLEKALLLGKKKKNEQNSLLLLLNTKIDVVIEEESKVVELKISGQGAESSSSSSSKKRNFKATDFDAVIIAHPFWDRRQSSSSSSSSSSSHNSKNSKNNNKNQEEKEEEKFAAANPPFITPHVTIATIVRAPFSPSTRTCFLPAAFNEEEAEENNHEEEKSDEKSSAAAAATAMPTMIGTSYEAQRELENIRYQAAHVLYKQQPEKKQQMLDLVNKMAARRPHQVFYRSIGVLSATHHSHFFKSNQNNKNNYNINSSFCLLKVFSDDAVRVEQLETILNSPVEIVDHVKWDGAYPKLRVPKTEEDKKKKNMFVLFRPAKNENVRKQQPLVVHAGALEGAVSTLETQSISAMNAALLVSDYLFESPSSSPSPSSPSSKRDDQSGGDL